MSRIIWLASYPKSGSTWVRVFLSNYLQNAETPAAINALRIAGTASSRQTFEDLVGVEASDLTPAQIDACRPAAYRLLAAQSDEPLFLKVHDACGRADTGEPLFPADVTGGVLYVVRHPCDVAVSYAHHNGVSLERAIAVMATATHALSGRSHALEVQLRQTLSTWSGHVCSWLGSGLPVHVLRYEDLLAHPVEGFGAAIGFLGWPLDPARLSRAIEFSGFDELQAQEGRGNFNERPQGAPAFFRSGRAGGWRRVLTGAQVAAIVEAHGPVMRRFGYLDEGGQVR